MNKSLKQRIALHYIIATAFTLALVFGLVFFIVKSTVYQNLDSDLSYEANKHTKEVALKDGRIYFFDKEEWEEREHMEVQVNPVFIQVTGLNGEIMDKSPNLKAAQLTFDASKNNGEHFNSQLNERAIRQVRFPIKFDDKVVGYILAAMSLEASQMVIQNLLNVLLLSYPIVMIGLFFSSRYLAGRSIKPIQTITSITDRITKNNLNERIPLPKYQDELFILTSSINQLLERIEAAMQRERQFTSDASHELRTPLAALRGTMEIMVRKPRTHEEYQEKVTQCLIEVDRMTSTIDQLLTLARFEQFNAEEKNQRTNLITLIDEVLSRQHQRIQNKGLKVKLNTQDAENIQVPYYYSNLIIENIISNAIKYAYPETTITIEVNGTVGQYTCTVKDQGIGIKPADMDQLFHPFFRSDALAHKHIGGSGLGLSIVKKAAETIQAKIELESVFGESTTVKVKF